MTCTATNGVVVNRGAKLVWADVDPVTGLIDPWSARDKLNGNTKAIIGVDWAGRSCDYRALRQYGVPVIQDAAHNLFVDMDNAGDYVAWSFQAIKHLTTGDGGALMPPRSQYDRARLLRWYGLDRESTADFRCAQNITEAGYKYHMNDVAASIGLANLPHMKRLVQVQRTNAHVYDMLLADAPGVTLPPPDPASSWWLYTVLVDDRADFIAHLQKRLVAASPVHRRNDEHDAFHFPSGDLPGVDHFSARECAIPVGWWAKSAELQHVASAVLEWAHSRARAAVAA